MAYTFPHELPADRSEAANIVRTTPFMDELVVAFALNGVEALQLGKGPQTDLLAVSLSATDVIGHRFGPDSREIHDQVLRVDRAVGVLLDSLFKLRDSSTRHRGARGGSRRGDDPRAGAGERAAAPGAGGSPQAARARPRGDGARRSSTPWRSTSTRTSCSSIATRSSGEGERGLRARRLCREDAAQHAGRGARRPVSRPSSPTRCTRSRSRDDGATSSRRRRRSS